MLYVRNKLQNLADKIKEVYPKSPNLIAPTNEKEKIKVSMIGDIQRYLAEIYAILIRETEDDTLDANYQEAKNQFPERIASIFNTISVLALAVKTKLKINDFSKVFDSQFIESIHEVCLECYKIELIIAEKNDPDANRTFQNGITKALEYSDYKTGFKRSISPGFLPGQLRSFRICTEDQNNKYSSMIINIQELLDPTRKLPSQKDRLIFSISNSNQPINLIEIRQPKTLVQLSAEILIKNRSSLFKKLEILPDNLKDKFPELNIDYKNKFGNKIKKLVNNPNFSPNANEKKYLNLILNATSSKNPFNEVHKILQELDGMFKTGYLSTFKDNMQPIRNKIVKYMQQYNTDKEEYKQHFGKIL